MANDLLRKMYKARPPPLPPHFDDDDVDITGESLDTLSSSLSLQSPSPAVHPSRLGRSSALSASDRYAPLDWKNYFEEKRLVTVQGEDDTEAEITFNVFENRGKPGAALFVMHHGAGQAGMSFALTAKEIKETVGKEASVLAFDCRGHGKKPFVISL